MLKAFAFICFGAVVALCWTSAVLHGNVMAGSAAAVTVLGIVFFMWDSFWNN